MCLKPRLKQVDMSAFLSRRNFLLGAGLTGIAATGYAYQRGLRFPPLSFEPRPAPIGAHIKHLKVSGEHLIRTQRDDSSMLHFRAIAPEPRLQIAAHKATTITLVVGNIATDAVLQNTQGTMSEQHKGINRQLTIQLARNEQVQLHWQLPKLKDYTFASIGDTGGDLELAWCIQRAHELGARFLLHLGDFNYQSGDYQRAIQLFGDAPLPCYVAIGNHDFHDNGLIYNAFLNEIGTLNHRFNIGNTRFVNIDTAASFLPYGAGLRGALFKAMRQDERQYASTVAFTHKPLHNPASGSDYQVGANRESDWLANALKKVGIKTLLSGHIHVFDRQTFDGIDNIIVGQGLGHQDLIAQQDASKMALGQVNQQGEVSYVFAPLAMAMELHCHPRTDIIKNSLRDSRQHTQLLQRIHQACLKTS